MPNTYLGPLVADAPLGYRATRLGADGKLVVEADAQWRVAPSGTDPGLLAPGGVVLVYADGRPHPLAARAARDARRAMIPPRIRLRRRAGWRLPSGAVSIARPSLWGNPFTVADYGHAGAVHQHQYWLRYGHTSAYPLPGESARLSDLRERVLAEAHKLIGRTLACWCREHDPCHGDNLLELVSSIERGQRR